MKKVFFFLVSLFCFMSIYVCVLQTDCFGELANLSVADAENSVNQNNFGDSGEGINNYVDETFTVTFYDYDKLTVLHTETYTTGTTVTYDDPIKELNDGYTYKFTGWKYLTDDTTATLSTITTTTSVYATYSITFIVTFYDSDKETELKSVSFTKGETVSYGSDPTKTSEDYNYEFSGWAYLSDDTAADLSTITTTTSVYATYIVTFTVTFYADETRTTYTTQTYNVNDETEVSYSGQNPTKSSSNGYTYTFAGWKYVIGDGVATLSDIKTNTSVYAYYTATFTVVFYTSDSEYTTSTFDEGDQVSYTGTTPTKEETDEYTYTFAYWVDANNNRVYLSEITTSTTVYAYFTATAKFFNVYFYDTDKESLLYTGTYYTGTEYTVEYKGETTLTKADDVAYENYTLVWKDLSAGFSITLSEITSTCSVYADFEGTAVTYSVTIYTAYVNSGVTSGVNKTKYFTIESKSVSLSHGIITGYTFVRYTTTTSYDDVVTSTSITISSTDDLYNRTYYAWYTVSTYTVSFSVSDDTPYGTIYNGDSELSGSLTVSHGSSISVNGNAITITDASSSVVYTITATAYQSDGSYSYSFYSWSISTGSSTSITQNTEITAIFEATRIGYKIEYNSTYLSVYNDEEEVGTGTYIDSGTEIVVVAKTDKITDNYHFGYVTLTYSDETTKTVYDEDGDNTITITVDGSMLIEAVEVIDTHTITFSVEEEGYGTLTTYTISSEYGSIISVSGAVVSVQYQTETAKTVTASTTEKNAQYSYEFSYYKIYGSSESLTEMTLTEDTQIVAVFVRTTNQYSVTFENSNVSVEFNGQAISSGDNVYYGSVLTVTYNQKEHYHMTSFLANGTAISNNQVTVTENVTITYAEEIDTFLLTFGDGIMVVYKGTENQILSGNYFDYGTEFTASYTLSKNYKLVKFTCNSVSVENNYTFALSEDVTLLFEEEKDVILITVEKCSNGTISVPESAVYGETVEISVSPDEDYKLSKIYYVGAETGEEITIENLTFVMPNEQITIYAEFELEYYILKDEDTEIIVKIDRTMFETEPVLTVSVETENYVVAANSLFNGSNYAMYNISILVNGESVSTFGDYITIIIPFECENSELAQVVYLNENGYGNLAFDYDEETGFLIQTKIIGTIAVGEVTQTAKNPVESDDTETSNSSTTTIIIIASSVGGAVAVGGVGTFIVLRRRRRI